MGRWFSVFFDNVGDGSGDIDANVDGTSPESFLVTAPAGYRLTIRAIRLQVDGRDVPDYASYGDSTASNGCLLSATAPSAFGTGTRTIDLLGGVPLTSNKAMMMTASSVVALSMGATDKTVTATWLFDDGALVLEPGYSLTFTVRDDLSAMNGHRISASGTSEIIAKGTTPLARFGD